MSVFKNGPYTIYLKSNKITIISDSRRFFQKEILPKDLYSEILPGLFMGGTHDDDVVYAKPTDKHKINSNKFDCVITMYAWANPTDWGVEEIRYGIPDSDINDANIKKLLDIAYWGYRRWLSGEKVLIRCQAGLNRSGLITSLILIMDGLFPMSAVNLIREKRTPFALFNQNYVTWLTEQARDEVKDFLESKHPSIINLIPHTKGK
jgi:hypothetical protein